jgi:hypothetical protein
MAAGAGMKLMVMVLIYFGIFGLTAGKFFYDGWNWNEDVDLLIFMT